VVLMASPMAHQTGFMYGLMMPIMLKASAVLQDIWEPLKAIDLIRTESVTFTMASTPFLTDLAHRRRGPARRCPRCDLPVRWRADPRSAGRTGARGAGRQDRLGLGHDRKRRRHPDQARRRRRARLHHRRLPAARRGIQGGRCRRCKPATGQPGKLLLRACSNFGGYLKRPQWNATDAEDWFDTGDLASSTNAAMCASPAAART
jgi:cyclohexanecarboxylate-CoA ligase